MSKPIVWHSQKDELDLAELNKTINAFYEFITKSSESFAGKKIQWSAKVKSGSNIVEVIPTNYDPKFFDVNKYNQFREATEDNIAKLSRGEFLEGVFDNKACAEVYHNFITTCVNQKASLNECKIEEKTAETTGKKMQLLNQEFGTYYSVGCVEGVLKSINAEREIETIGIEDSITKHIVMCEIYDCIIEEIIQNAERFFKQRVSLFGNIKYKQDKPLSIKVEDIGDISLLDEDKLSYDETLLILNKL